MTGPVVAARPAARYGVSRRPSRTIALVIGALVVLAGIGVAYMGYERFGPKEIEGEQISYAIVNDSTISIRFTVTRQQPDRAAVCILRARSKDASETGRREVYIEPSGSGTVEVNSELRTSQPPAVGEVYGCSFEIPPYLKTE
ncbi:DUF4307 domain-containing protein [Antrihabitans sp. YC2-6]|uniref:DUF4307 domain-containing protein n=1 Tax=Antrihabitans sp. YC2-6 TaxID=2799498 RepID=UPI0018F3BB85|nr:DUF4307 domain-containing protein [Antrihabitans sp. YC2-6]MBJ8343772.1 DUF4307 domain-containing protein [Antrihabitans sp. YC2-6]